ncbi:MAG: alkaline phosphatase family protein [Isosphaeraceae bacterium]
MSAHVSRVLFLGLDGGTMTALRPWFDRGLTPHLAGLWKSAAYGTLRSSDPMVTPVAWTSFLTGCNPVDHGIHEFYYVESADWTIRSNHAGRVLVPNLWQILSAEGRSVVSLNLPMNYPPPRVKGIVVAGSDSPGLDWAFAQCPAFGQKVRMELPDYSHKIVWKRRPRSLDELQELARRNRAIFRAQVDAAERADERHDDWSALMVHFHNLDSLQHRLWPFLGLDETAEHRVGWNEEVEDCIRVLDESVGRLLDLAARRNAAVIAVSDHGFGPCKALVNVNGLLRDGRLQRGLMYGTRFRYRAQRLGERLHRWMTRRAPGGLGRRLPRSVDGALGCDWKRTVAFAPFGQLCGSIFLNPANTTRSSVARQVIDEVIGICQSARDPETQEPLFRDVFSTADRYGVDPEERGMPEVLALSADGYQAQAKWGVTLRNQILRPDPNLPATHWMEGVIAISAPGVVSGQRLGAELNDVAPTTLALLGLPIPDSMTGRVLHEAFRDPLEARFGGRPEIEEDPDYARFLAAGFGAECA